MFEKCCTNYRFKGLIWNSFIYVAYYKSNLKILLQFDYIRIQLLNLWCLFCNKESKILWKHINWSYPGKRRNNLHPTSNSSCRIQPRWHRCCYGETILWHGNWWVSIRAFSQKTKLVCKGQRVTHFCIWWSVRDILFDILSWAYNSLFVSSLYELFDSHFIFDFQNSLRTMKRRGFTRQWQNWDRRQNMLRFRK